MPNSRPLMRRALLILVILAAVVVVGDVAFAQSGPTGLARPTLTLKHKGPSHLQTPAAPVAGDILFTSNGSWSQTPSSFAYLWQDCNATATTCSTASGSPTNTNRYVIATGDVGFYIRVAVTATFPSGLSATQYSLTTAVVGTSGTAVIYRLAAGTTSPYTDSLGNVWSADATSAAASSCSLYASPTGSDSNAGTSGAPFATVAKLETSLTAGQTGCLNAGSYGTTTSPSAQVLSASGTGGSPIVLTSTDPSNVATIKGWFSITGSNITVQDVKIDGANTGFAGPNPCGATNVSQALDIEGTGDILQYIDFTESAGSGNAIGIGFNGAGSGNGTIVRNSTIHDVGNCQAFDHLIYLSHGDSAQIYGNWLWNDAHGFGVQVYPCPTNANIHSNVIDKAITGFVVESSGCTVSGNIMTHNVIANSVGQASAGTTGQGVLTCCASALSGNSFDTNDVFNNPAGVGAGATGLTVTNNITTDPLFVNAAAHNYAVQAGSPAAGYGLPVTAGPSAFPGGVGVSPSPGTTDCTTHAITGTPDQALYQCERWGASPGFTYTFPSLTPGAPYTVGLKFAEINSGITAGGGRQFNVTINGTQVLTNFDIVANAPGQYVADDKSFSTNANGSGQIVINFSNGAIENPKVAAIQISSGTGPLAPVNTVVPAISGSLTQGNQLTTTTGTWTGTPPINYTYQWQNCVSGTCSNIAGATNSTYSLTAGDVGDTIRTAVTATNAAASITARSAQTTTIQSSNVGACGQAVPGSSAVFGARSYAREGWDTFTKTSPLGSMASSSYTTPVYTGDQGMQWYEYPDGAPATFTGSNEGYEPSTVQSVHDGVLDYFLHTSATGHPVAANPSPAPNAGSQYQTYGAYSFCQKIVADAGSNLSDYKEAILLWPTLDANGGAAESDYPEASGGFTSINAPLSYFAHFGGSSQDSGTISQPFDISQWHVFTQTWAPGQRCYFVDGNQVGCSTNQVWSGPERWQLQFEPAQNAPNNGGHGHAYINWAWIGTEILYPVNSVLPSISPSGSPTVGSTLTTTNGTWTNSPTSFSYQWQHCTGGNVCSNVGTNQNSYVVTSGDSGDTIQVIVTASNANGNSSATSAKTGAIAGTITHIVWIMNENESRSSVIGPLAYETGLASTYGDAVNGWVTVDHPSLPNHYEMSTGHACSDGCSDDAGPGSHVYNEANIWNSFGSNARSYAEGIASNCNTGNNSTSQGDSHTYAVRHNPWPYFQNTGERSLCGQFSLPMGRYSQDWVQPTDATPDISSQFTYILPDECHNSHDCAVSNTDAFMQTLVPALLATPQYQAGNTVIFLTYDEGYNIGPMIVISPFTSHIADTTNFGNVSWYSLLRYTLSTFGYSLFSGASTATPLNGHFGLP